MNEPSLNRLSTFAGNTWFVLPALVTVALACAAVVAFPGAVELEKDQAAGWDILLKTVGGSAALLTAVLALPKYFAERSATNRAALAEARRPYFTAQQSIYAELLDVTARLSNPSAFTEAEIKAASAAFWTLYWGKLPLVIDDEVGLAVNNFEQELCSPDRSEIGLRNSSMQLARACANSLGFRKSD